MSDKNNYNPQTHDYTVNIGNRNIKIDRIIIQMPYDGTFSFNSIEIYTMDYAMDMSEIVSRLTQSIHNTSFMDNKIKFTSDSTNRSLVCIGIPYNSGWEAFVDGKKTETIPVNIAFLGIELDKGRHEVELIYKVPGMTLGRVISLVSIIILGVIFTCENYKSCSKHMIRLIQRDY